MENTRCSKCGGRLSSKELLRKHKELLKHLKRKENLYTTKL